MSRTSLITKLTPEQEVRFPEFVRKWVNIGLCTKPADRERAEKAICGLYALAKLREPRVIWLPCPISAALSAVVYAALINKRLIPNRGNEARSVDSAVRSAVRSAVGSAVYSAVGSAVGSAVRSAVYSAVDSAVYSAVYSAVGSAVRSAVGSAVDSAVRSAVYSAVGSAVGSAVDSAVDSAVGSAVGSAVDSAVGSAVDSAVDSAVGSAVDSAVGSAVDSAVDSAVYSAVDSAVYSAVGSAVYSAGTSFFGGSLWPGYQAWADYFNEVCGVAIDRNYLEAAESCGFYWTLDSVCFASERPSEILRDDAGRLHNPSGLAIRYPSGWGLYRVHGVEVPRDIIEDRATITVKRIESEANAEVRRVMVELYGQQRFLLDSNAKVISHDQTGILYRKDLGDDEPIVMVRVLNSTPEPDGVMSRDEAIEAFGIAAKAAVYANDESRFKEYSIRVPPDIRTAHEAVAWTFGLRKEEYHPALET